MDKKLCVKARFMLFSWRVEYVVCESEVRWTPFPSANVNKDTMSPNQFTANRGKIWCCFVQTMTLERCLETMWLLIKVRKAKLHDNRIWVMSTYRIKTLKLPSPNCVLEWNSVTTCFEKAKHHSLPLLEHRRCCRAQNLNPHNSECEQQGEEWNVALPDLKIILEQQNLL